MWCVFVGACSFDHVGHVLTYLLRNGVLDESTKFVMNFPDQIREYIICETTFHAFFVVTMLQNMQKGIPLPRIFERQWGPLLGYNSGQQGKIRSSLS